MNAQGLLNAMLNNLPDISLPPISLLALDDGAYLDCTGDLNQIFDIGSLTKILSTTAIILKLVEEGTLALDDSVSRYLQGESFSRIFVKDLLCHRAGLWEWRPLYIELQSKAEIVPYIEALALRYPINSERHYSDLGFILLGLVIEEIVQKPLDEIFTELVAEPLGLLATTYAKGKILENCVPSSFGDRAEIDMLRQNSPYPVNVDPNTFLRWRTHVLKGEVNDGNTFHLMNGVSGHAGLFSSVRDLMAFGRELLNSLSGEGYFDPSLLREFLEFNREPEQALGFQRYEIGSGADKVTALGHTGFPGVALTIIPDKNLVLGLFTNRLLVDGKSLQTKTVLTDLLQRIFS